MEFANEILAVVYVEDYINKQFEKTINSLLFQTTNIDILVLDKSNTKKLAKKVAQLNNGNNKISYQVAKDSSISSCMLESIQHFATDTKGGGGIISKQWSICM